MPEQLRVDPEVLTSTGATVAQVGSELSAMNLGQSLSGLSGAAPGFDSGTIGGQVGTALDDACKKAGESFSRLGTNLQSAAEKYRTTDDELSKKIKQSFEPDDGKDGKDPGKDGGKDGKEPPPPNGSGDIDLSKLTPEQRELVKNFQLPASAVPAQFRDNVPEYRKRILEAAIKNGIPPEVLAAQIEQESGWNPNIQNSEGRDSWGLSQAERAAWNDTPTGRAHPITPENDGTPDDPRRNIEWAINFQAEYDKWCHDNGKPLYPDDPLRSMLDAYNGGIGNPQAAEDQGYYQNIMARLSKYQIDPSLGIPKLGVPSTLPVG